MLTSIQKVRGDILPPFFKSIIIGLACQAWLLLTAWLSGILVDFSGTGNGQTFESFREKLIVVLIVAPILETLVLNLALNELLLTFLRKTFVIIASSVCFGLMHIYSIPYMIFTFAGALALNISYFYFKEKYGLVRTILIITVIHFNHNLVGILLGK